MSDEKKYTLNEVARMVEDMRLNSPTSAYTGYTEKIDLIEKAQKEIASKLRSMS